MTTNNNNNSSNFPLRLALFIDAVNRSTLKVKECKAITGGGLGKGNTKMPGRTYGISAWRCITGSKLAEIAGSVCSICYARKGNYRFRNVKDAFIVRADSLVHPLWAEAMAVQIRRYSSDEEFRWQDTGDLQSLEHLLMIIMIAEATPSTDHWLPTREITIIRQLEKLVLAGQVSIPSNLCIRVSSHFNGQKPWRRLPSWCNTSTVDWKDAPVTCEAPRTDKNARVHTVEAFKAYTPQEKKALDFGHCGDCRKCWDKDVNNTNYYSH